MEKGKRIMRSKIARKILYLCIVSTLGIVNLIGCGATGAGTDKPSAKSTQSQAKGNASAEEKGKIELKDLNLPAEFTIEKSTTDNIYLVRDIGYTESINITIRDKKGNETGHSLLEGFGLSAGSDSVIAAKEDHFSFSIKDSALTEDDSNKGIIYHYGRIVNDQIIEFQLIYPESDLEFGIGVIDFLVAEIRSK